MIFFRSVLVALSTLMLLAACSTSPRVTTDANPSVNFANYRAFAWISANPMISGPAGMSPLTAQRIRNEIASGLVARGYRQVTDAAAADFVVGFTVGSRAEIQVTSFPSTYRGTWGWGRGYWGAYPGYDTQVTSYTEGRLAIDIFDVRTKQPAWHGWTEKRITRAIERDPGPAIQEVVSAILDRFPVGG